MFIKTILPELLHDQRGATAVEYGLICALIVVGAMLAFQKVADGAITIWGYVSATATESTE